MRKFDIILSNLFKPKWKTTPVTRNISPHAKMKIGVAFYYKDIEQYNPAWVNKCIDSMRRQTYEDFDVYVLNYGENENNSFDFMMGNKHHYLHKPLINYAAAMNCVYSRIFKDCDVAVNTNIDDYYDTRRIEVLLQELKNGADIASSNVRIIDENNNVTYSPIYHKMNVLEQLSIGFNPVSNPCHIMKKRVFEALQFDPSLVPVEDMDFWKRAIAAGFKIVINQQRLHFYRMHSNQSTHKFVK